MRRHEEKRKVRLFLSVEIIKQNYWWRRRKQFERQKTRNVRFHETQFLCSFTLYKKIIGNNSQSYKKFNIAVCITIFWTYTTSVGRITFKGYRQSVTIHRSKFHPKTLQQHREKWN